MEVDDPAKLDAELVCFRKEFGDDCEHIGVGFVSVVEAGGVEQRGWSTVQFEVVQPWFLRAFILRHISFYDKPP